VIHNESAAAYHTRPAVSAGLLWDITQECPAYAYARSVFCPEEKRIREETKEMNFGRAVHFAGLQPELWEDQVTVIDAKDYRTKAAQEYREMARFAGKTPLLAADVDLIAKLRQAILESAAGPWFEEGACEQSVTFEFGASPEDPLGQLSMPCKLRVDCVAPFAGGPLLDLKTAQTANPEAFSRACTTWGHHLRAAWYKDGWLASEGERRPYVFVIVSKTEPHLVETYVLDDRSEEWGRRLYRRALAEVRLALEEGKWRSYSAAGEKKPTIISLPAFAERQLIEAFAAN